jgi:CRP/FNR family transcriptional regulator, cyclic AMP receptor protein
MFTTYEVSENFRYQNRSCQETLRALLGLLEISCSETVVSKLDGFSIRGERSRQFHVLEEGMVRCLLDGKPLFYLEAFDMLGDTPVLLDDRAEISSEFTVRIKSYDRVEFLNAVNATPEFARAWSTYLEYRLSMYAELMAALTAKGDPVHASTLHFNKGQVIIVQNSIAKDVYTMLNGEADVYLDDNHIGEVLEGEIFGAMAATTHLTRTASVIARTDCVVLSVPKEYFLTLAETHPRTLLKLIDDMTRIIVSQNEKLAQFQEE